MVQLLTGTNRFLFTNIWSFGLILVSGLSQKCSAPPPLYYTGFSHCRVCDLVPCYANFYLLKYLLFSTHSIPVLSVLFMLIFVC